MFLRRSTAFITASLLVIQFSAGFQSPANAASTVTLTNSIPAIDPNTSSVVVGGVVGDSLTFTTASAFDASPTVTFSGSGNHTSTATLVPNTTSTYTVTVPRDATTGAYSVSGDIGGVSTTLSGSSNFQVWPSHGEPYVMPAGHLNITYQDLRFILDNIKMAEAHSIRTRVGGATGVASNSLSVEVPTTTLIYPYDLTSITRCLTAADLANAAKNSGAYSLGSTGLSAPYVWTQEDPYGLRQVDGQCNNISNVQAEAAQTTIYTGTQAADTAAKLPVVPVATSTDTAGWGAADELFGRILPSTTQPSAPYSLTDAQKAYQDPTKNVVDATPRDISNLISDQTTNNPAAVAAAYEATSILYGASGYATENSVNATTGAVSTVLDIPNITSDYNVSAGYDSSLTIFGQFFDHGLDLIPKAGPSVLIPLRADDPLYMPGQNNFMVLTRGQDSVGDSLNETTPWIDQSQSYGSHPSQNFFLREYNISSSNGVATISNTGRLLEGQDVGHKTLVNDITTSNKGLPTWFDIKAQTARLGFNLTDYDAMSVPVIATDQYGKFIPGPHGYPMMLFTDSNTRKYVWVEGNGTSPISTGYAGTSAFPSVSSYSYPSGTNWKAVPSGHAFINDTTASAVPYAAGYCPNHGARLTADTDNVVNSAAWAPNCSSYDNETLDLHYVAGDGRVNENIALSAYHGIFHSEHNLIVKDIVDELNNNPIIPAAFKDEFLNNPDRLYQAGRFVMEMEYQHMAYDEFIRRIAPNLPVFITYDPTKNPAVTQEFASAVYRLGHSMLNETIPRAMPGQAYDPTNNEDVSLLDAFTNPSLARMHRPSYIDSASYSAGRITYTLSVGEVAPNNGDVVTISYLDNSGFNVIDGIATNYDALNNTFDISQKYVNGALVNISAPTGSPSSSLVANGMNYAKVTVSNSVNGPDYTPMESAAMLIQGLTAQRGNEIDEFTTDAVRNNLLGLPLDLPSLNLTRGRDVGVPTLNQYRAKNSTVLPPYVSWVDFINKLRHPSSGSNFVAAYGTHPLLTAPVKIATSTAAVATGGAITYSFTPIFNTTYHIAEMPKVGDIVDISGFGAGSGNLTGGVISSVVTTTNPMTFTVSSTVANNLSKPAGYASTDPNFYGDMTPVNLAVTINGSSTVSYNVIRQPNLSERRTVATSMTTTTFPVAITDVTPSVNGYVTFTGVNNFSPGQIVTVSGMKGGANCYNLHGTVMSSDVTQFTLGQSSNSGSTTPTTIKVVSASWSNNSATYVTEASSNFAVNSEISITGLPIASFNVNDAIVTAVGSSGTAGRKFFKISMPLSAAPTPVSTMTNSLLYGTATSAQPHNLNASCAYQSQSQSGGFAIASGLDTWAPLPAAPSDTADFMNSANQTTTDWRNTPDSTMGQVGSSKTGIDAIDLWMGGLAENPAKQPILPGMLGTTFQEVYSQQVQLLQDADRFYYLGRLMGYNLVDGLQGQKFASMVLRNTPSAGTNNPSARTDVGIMGLTNPSFSVSDCSFSTNASLVPAAQTCDAGTMFTNTASGVISHVGLDNITMFADPSVSTSVSLAGGAGDDSIQGGPGNDTLDGGLGGDVMTGGAGNDLILGGAGEDIIQGNSGNDIINTGDSQIGDLADGGSGSDWITCGNCHAVIPLFSGGTGDDFVQGGANADLLLNGGEGDDWIEGLGGWDIINGDEGISQQIYNTTTQIYGGNDVIEGNAGVNTESGDGGDDIFLVGQGVDQIFGMSGFDWVDYEYSNRYDNGPAVRPNIWIDLSGASLSPNTSRQGDMLGTTEAISGSFGNDQIYGGIGTADATYTANVVSGSNIITLTTAQTINPGQQVSGAGIGANATVALSTIKGTKTEVTLTVASTATGSVSVLFTTWPLQAPTLITNLTSLVSGTPGWTKYTALDPAATKWSGGAILLGGDGNDSIYPSTGSDVIHGSAYLHTCIAVSPSVPSTVYAAVADVPCGNGTGSTTRRGFSNMSLATALLENRSITPDQLTIVREILPTSTSITSVVATGGRVTYTAANNYYVGELITISHLAAAGADLTPYNLTNMAVTSASASTFTVAAAVPDLTLTTGATGTSVPTDTLDLSGGSTVFLVGTVPGVGGGISGPSNQFTFKPLTTALPAGASFGCTVTDRSTNNVITVFDVEMVKFTTGNAVPIPNCGGVSVPAVPSAPTVRVDSTNQNIVLTWTAPANNGSPIDYYNFQSATAAVPASAGVPARRAGNATAIAAGTCSGNVPASLSSTGCTVLNLTPGTSYTFRISAHNAIGSSAYSANSVSAVFPTITGPSIVLSSHTQTVTVGSPITPVTLQNSGGPVGTYTVATTLGGSTLPAGISFDPVTGTISGTPTSNTGSPVTFTVQARNVTGTSQDTFVLTIDATGAAPSLSFTPNSQSVVAGSAMVQVIPSNTAGAVIGGFAAGSSIPSWITVDPSNGAITGTPPASFTPGPVAITVRASNGFGASTAVFTLNVTGAPVISYPVPALSVAHGTALPTGQNAVKPVNTGGAAESFACASVTGGSCPLPTGVSFNTSSGAFTGVPTLSAPAVSFSVTATNSAGTSAATLFVLTVTDPVAGVAVAPGAAVITFTNNVTTPLPAGTAVTLSATSTGVGTITYSVSGANCQLTRNSLVATAPNTTCVVTATQAVTTGLPVSQSITFTFGLQAQASLRINNRTTTATHGLGITITTSGGSGTGAVSYQVITQGSGPDCRLTTDGTGVTSATAGVCVVTATKAASGIFDAITSPSFTFNFR